MSTNKPYQVAAASSGLGGAVEALLLQTNATRGAFDGWTAETRSNVDSVETAHRSAMAEAKRELETKRIQATETENKVGAFSNIKQAHEGAVASERSALASLENVLQELPSKASALRTEATVAAAEVTKLQAERSRKSAAMEHSINELTQGVLMYKHLGLEFHRAEDDRLLIRFTNIDPLDWEREFTFHVGLGSNDAYSVTGCSPVIEEGTLEALLGRLNAPNEVDPMEFPKFVLHMRRAFKSLV